ncbi:beta strand repeat-containing protein [Tahibacter amnicola]|uniref:Ig-like domain-containing protein n=1 Tax=Tahibacter amnicola TaxID=2976241 RepID=A0ABY6BC72_9GAMM|nr:Ig-like domain-containing protein [Tahibacter amnicola]UXI65920.1 Ig-like domain-containing protein [Tahibacter amnicola]
MAGGRMWRLGSAVLAILAASQASGQLIISEFRVRGPNGANDEFIEVQNISGADHTVAGGGTGYAIAASDGVARAVIPNGTVIPNKGHYLAVNSVGYSLASYPAGNGTTATGDATYTTDIPDNAGIALFNTSVAVDFTLANRMDAVGSTSEANTLYKEGTGYPALTPFSIDYAFYRDLCGKGGSITTFATCPSPNAVADTNNNAADFVFVDTNGTSAGAGQRLGAPSPENLSSPLNQGGNTAAVLDSCVGQQSPPNIVRDFTSDPANNSTFGTLDVRYTYTNNTGGNQTRLRFRIVDLTTFPAPSGISDLRPRTSTAVVVTVDRPPCGSGTSNVTVNGTTLEQPPSQPNGGGFDSTMSAGTVTLATPLANGASIDVRFLFGIQQTGTFKFGIIAEGLPTGGGFTYYEGCTDTCPFVSSIVRVNPTPTGSATVDYTVTFSESVDNVDAADFAITTTGSLAGASVGSVTGTGATRTVTVNTGTGAGTLRLDLQDNNTITGTTGNEPLGGPGVDNGDFLTGEVYDVDRESPTVTVEQDGAQADPTAASPINFAVVFSEAVTGFTNASVTLGGTALPTTAFVTGSGTTYNIAVSGMTANGTVTASVNAAAGTDALGNASVASTSTDNTVTFTGADTTPPTVTVEQAVGQADPTGTSPINFTVTFSEATANFATGDVTLGGTAGATTASVTGGPTVFNVAVSGMTTNGTVTASVGAGVATDAAGNGNLASTSTDNTVTFNGFDLTPPTVTVEQAVGQADPTSTSPINFTVTFNEPTADFATGDVTLGGTAGATTATVTGGPTVFNVAVSGMTTNGTVTASVAAGVATDGAGNANLASTSVDNTVTFDGFDLTPPTVTVEQAVGQADPTATSPINFTVTFSEPTADFATGDVTLGGTAGATTATVTGGPTVFNVAVSGMTTNGTVTASVAAGVATDGAGNANLASTSVDNTVTFDGFDVTSPSVTIEQAVGQPDPAFGATINFTVTFSEPVTGFTTGDVTIGGTAGATTATVTGGPTVYNVAVSGMTANGTVTVSIAAGVATDTAGNPNLASTSTDGTVTFGGVQAVVPLPALSWQMLMALVALLAGVGTYMRRRVHFK